MKQAVVRKHNKPRPRVAHRGIFSELTNKVIRSSHGHFTPSLKSFMQIGPAVFSYLANKETNKQKNKGTKKSIENNTPSPDVSGTG